MSRQRDYVTPEAADQALDVAVDAVTRRARVLEGQDPEVAEALRILATRLSPRLFEGVFTEPEELDLK